MNFSTTIPYLLNKKVVIILSLAFLFSSNVAFAQVTSLVDFNNINDLTGKFNPSANPIFTNTANGGISDTGSINVPLASSEVWTTKQAYTVAGEGDIYTFSAYFKIQANSGYGGLGFTTSNTGVTSDSFGSPATGIGMGFHGGGGFFVNNRTNENVNWPPDLVIGNWYKMILRVEALGSNQYDLNFRIYNSDAAGVLGSLKTEQQTTITNGTVGTANIIYGYFSAAGSRMANIDDFEMTLEGGATFIEAGAPVVSTAPITNVTSSTATSGGEVVDDQGEAVTARGVCWSIFSGSTTGENCTVDGTGEGAFVSELTNLTPGETYFVRSYATNEVGTTYGPEETFTTDMDVTAPVLTEITPLTGTIDLEDATYYFTTSELCSLSATEPMSSKGEVTILAEQVVLNQNIGVTLMGMQEGGTYSFSISCIDEAENESNILQIGPFTIASAPAQRSSSSRRILSPTALNFSTKDKEEEVVEDSCSEELLLTQNLRKGAKNGSFNAFAGEIVQEAHILQRHLNRLGFDSGPEDGIIGPLTEAAIKRLQIFLGTAPDGLVGPLTRGLINKSCS